ncbi:MAG: hypothetical protein GX643_16875 [Acidimicrobiales bacterium]|nr:hypothetical protein [Acidimicrobiales bacterium]
MIAASHGASTGRRRTIVALAATGPSRWKWGFDPTRRPDVAFVALMAVLAASRFRTLHAGGAPATVDSGNWLAYGHDLLDVSVRDPSITYPPLVPLVVTSATGLFGPVTAVALVGALCSIAPAAGTYWALRTTTTSVTGRWLLVPLTGLLGAAGATGEATAWGGFPQLIGAGLAPVLLLLVDRVLRRSRLDDVIRAAVVLFILAATSHFAASYAVLAVGALVALSVATRGRGDRLRWLRSRLPLLAAIPLPCIALLPWYRPLLAAMARNPVTDTDATLTSDNVLRWIEFTYRDQPVLWRTLAIAGTAVVFLLWPQRHRRAWRLSTSAMAAVVIGSLLSREARFLHFLPLASVMAVGTWLAVVVAPSSPAPSPVEERGLEGARRTSPRPRSRPAPSVAAWCAAALVIALVIQGISGHRHFVEQREFYGIVDRDLHVALIWLRDETPAEAIVGVSTVDGAPLGWWVEGLSQRRTVYASPLQWLVHPDEQDRARLANELFDETFPNAGAFARARDEGIDLLVLPLTSGHIDPVTVGEFIEGHPGLVRYRNDGVVIFGTATDSGPLSSDPSHGAVPR